MKKIKILLLLTVITTLLFTGCGKNENELVISAHIKNNGGKYNDTTE